ncbi:unnamed protein product [Triticum turgidum subsp. durum]|uniref:Uncharacterized protein n=1 Tax=Triticum turgidum subsp. durum TaxID=4567 RepID=A0A9R1C0G1_TRITD|nr:unnamed protein product [Triticum turgidum subsp. durum]
MGSQALGARADGWHEDLDSVAAPTGSIGYSLSLALSLPRSQSYLYSLYHAHHEDRLIMEVTVPSTTSIEDP